MPYFFFCSPESVLTALLHEYGKITIAEEFIGYSVLPSVICIYLPIKEEVCDFLVS